MTLKGKKKFYWLNVGDSEFSVFV